jgi:hypothetical protein
MEPYIKNVSARHKMLAGPPMPFVGFRKSSAH